MVESLAVPVETINPGEYLVNGDCVIDSYQQEGNQVLNLEKYLSDGNVSKYTINFPLSALVRVKVFFPDEVE